MQTVALEKGERLREKENGLVLLPKPSLKLLGRWGEMRPALLFPTGAFQTVFSCEMGKKGRVPTRSLHVLPSVSCQLTLIL